MNAIEHRPLLARVPEVAVALGVGRTKVYELIESGDLPAIHIGRSVRIPFEAVRAYVERLTAKTAATSAQPSPERR